MSRDLDRKRWLVLLAACLINLCIGSLYAWSVFASPMAEYLGSLSGKTFSAGDLAIVFTVANSVGPLTMISGGYINDRLGPQWVVFTGGLFFGLGMFLSGFASSVPMLILTYGLGCGLGMGLVYGCTINNSVKFFPERRGLTGGLVTAVYGLSSVLIPPVAQALIASKGILYTFRIFGTVFTAVICLLAFAMKKCPAGYAPEGMKETGVRAAHKDTQKEYDWKQMLKSPVFYMMMFMLMCGAFSGLMNISQASPMAQKMMGMTPADAAICVSVLALFNSFGRVAAGFLSDRLGRISTIMGVFILSVIGLAGLMICRSGLTALFLASLAVVGICFGAFMGVFPGFTADRFGAEHNSVNYGIMFIGFALAGFFGPVISGRIVAESGSYTGGFILAMILSGAGIIISTVYKRMKGA